VTEAVSAAKKSRARERSSRGGVRPRCKRATGVGSLEALTTHEGDLCDQRSAGRHQDQRAGGAGDLLLGGPGVQGLAWAHHDAKVHRS
jgi:hypothetical protein